MGTTNSISDYRYDGLKNLTRGNTSGGEEDLATTLQALRVDTVANEASATANAAAALAAQTDADSHESRHILGGADEIDGDLLDIDFTPTNYTPTITAPATDADHLTAHLSGIGVELRTKALSLGASASVILTQSGQPNNTDTLVVGADTYEFLTVLAGGANIEVEIGIDAAATLAALLVAAAGGTENLLWDSPTATTLRLRAADAPQGNVIGSDPSIALDASGATNYIFNTGDVNMNTLAGKAASQQNMCATTLTITAAMITATTARVSFPFTPTSFQVTIVDSAGALQMGGTDNFVIDGDDIVITLGAGGAPDLTATDVVHIVAYA